MEHNYKGHKVLELEHEGKTAILIQDNGDLGYTGFYTEKPGAVTQGKDVEETLRRLSISYDLLVKWEEEDNK